MQKIHHVSFNNNWSAPYRVDEPTSVSVPQPMGHCDIEAYLLSHNAVIATKKVHLRAKTMMEIHSTGGVNIYIHDKHQVGGGYYTGSQANKERLFGKDCMNIVFENDHARYFFQQKRFNTVAFYLSANLLEYLLRMTNIVLDKQLKSFLSGKTLTPELRQLPLIVQAQRTIRDIQHCPYADPGLRQLFMEAKAQEWAVHLLAALDQSKTQAAEQATLSYWEKQRIQEAQERLLADLTHPPSLQELSHAVGLNEKKLTAGFKQFFGTTVYAWLREQRLQSAMQLLQESQHSIQHIAKYCGYKHQADFTHAFKARFCVTPSSVRNNPMMPV